MINNGFDNLVYPGGGVREFIFPALSNLEEPNIGTNTIIGFNPDNGDSLNFEGQTYTVYSTTAGMQINVESGLIIVLSNLFFFDDNWVINLV